MRNSISPRARASAAGTAAALGGMVQDLEHALPGGDALLQRSAHIDQAAQRRRNQHQGGQKAEELVELHVVGEHLPDGDEKNAAERHGRDALHDRIADGPRTDQFHVGGAVVLIDPFEPLGLMILGVENLDQAMRIDGFLGDARDVAHGILDAFAVAAKAAVGYLHQPRDHGRRDDAEHRQAPVHVEQRHQQRENGQAVADQRNRRAGRRRGDQFDVVGQFRQQLPGLLSIEIGRRQPQVVREHIVPQALDDLPSDPARVVALHIVADAAQGEQHHDPDGHLPQDGRIFHQECAMQEFLDQVRERRVGRCEQPRAQHADQEHPEIGSCVLQQPPVDRPGIAGRFRARAGGGAQGAASPWTVAIFNCANPSLPATSIAVTTA